MERKYSFKTVISLMLLAASATLLLSFLIFGPPARLNSELRRETARFQEARAILSAHYVGVILDEGYLTDVALAAAVRALGDPWSHFLTQEQYEEYLRSLENRQQGIGILFNRDPETNEMRVLSAMPGSPAEEAGLAAGDTIVTIEGEHVARISADDFREILAVNYGGSIVLEVRGQDDMLRDVFVEVRSYYVNPVSFQMLEGDVGYIRISGFEETAGTEAILAIETLLEQGAEGLVIDLRYNPGGRLDELLLLLDFILPEGEMFVFADYAGRETVRYSDVSYLSVPMVVLINERSGSAAEYMAAVLQEKEWATIVGMPTEGKSRSQIMIPLSDGGAILLSTSRYLTPGRVDLYEVGGIAPDWEIETEWGGPDLQLEWAVELLS